MCILVQLIPLPCGTVMVIHTPIVEEPKPEARACRMALMYGSTLNQPKTETLDEAIERIVAKKRAQELELDEALQHIRQHRLAQAIIAGNHKPSKAFRL